MQDNENKKVSLFDKLKKIIFIDDEVKDGNDVLPDYGKEETEPKVIIHTPTEEVPNIPSRLDVPEVKIEPEQIPVEEEVKKEEVVVEETPSPFQTFDEDEFERLTSRVARSEAKAKMQVEAKEKEHLSYNLPPTNRSTLSSVNNTNNKGKKPFTPSPVISPVYGILDKNYSKEDIVDKRTDRKNLKKDSLDIVRNKAYGIKEDTEEIEIPVKKEEVVKEEIKKEEVKKEVEEVKPKVIDAVIEEDIQIDEFPKTKSIDSVDASELPKRENKAPIEEELDSMINNYDDYEDDLVKEEHNTKLDDLEKTSTLKILDDIEKELNSIKPVSSEITNEEEKVEEPSEQILEKDIFNMISSMYAKGDEEDDND